MTLLELLLVLSILAAVALSALSVVGEADVQVRYDDATTRLELVRSAALGQADQAGAGRGYVAGFAADVGRLPQSIDELLVQGALAPYQVDPNHGLGHGWRGPYLRGVPSAGGTTFPDPWGNWDPARTAESDPAGPDHGWAVSLAAEGGVLQAALTVRSPGPDGKRDSEDDWPRAGAPPLVVLRDHLVDVGGWPLTVVLRNASALPYGPTPLRLRLYVPDGAGGVRAVDSDPTNVDVPAKDSSPFPFVFPASPTWIPWGRRTLQLVTADPDPALRTVVPTGSTQHLPVDLIPRAALTIELPGAWTVAE